MELQNFINNNDNYIELLKELKIKSIKYSNKKLIILKINRGNNYDYEKYPWIKYCRGVIIDTNKNKIVNLPPSNSIHINNINEITINDDFLIENLIDGTMINLFFHDDKWILSTRSNIGCNNKWGNNKSFLNLFNECNHNLDYEELDKEHCYTFVLQHNSIRNIVPIFINQIILVNEIDLNTLKNVKSLSKLSNILNINDFRYDFYGNLDNLEFYNKGITIKNTKTNDRYKWINPRYKYVFNLKGNYNHKYLEYDKIRKKHLLNEYLNYFPEDRLLFNEYNLFNKRLCEIIYRSYHLYFVKKEIELNEINYVIKPIIFELHNFYLKNKEYISKKIINDYLYNIPGKRMIFIMNRIIN